MIGAYIPREVSEELDVLALYHKVSRSELFRLIIAEKLQNEDVPAILASLGQRIQDSWLNYYSQLSRGPRMNFDEFCSQARLELEKRKITKTYTEAIMNKAKEFHETA